MHAQKSQLEATFAASVETTIASIKQEATARVAAAEGAVPYLEPLCPMLPHTDLPKRGIAPCTSLQY